MTQASSAHASSSPPGLRRRRMSRFVRQEKIHLEVGPQQLALAVSEGDVGQSCRTKGAHLVPGVNGDVDSEAFEVDLLGWSGSRVLAGEVKRQVAGFTSVANDVRNSARFGADVHVAATLGRVGADLRAELEAACASERVELRVLDAKELLITGRL
jgi:hypothetical protein